MQTQGALLAEHHSLDSWTSERLEQWNRQEWEFRLRVRDLASSPHKKPSAHKAKYQLKDSNAHVLTGFFSNLYMTGSLQKGCQRVSLLCGVPSQLIGTERNGVL